MNYLSREITASIADTPIWASRHPPAFQALSV
jgi:hypothetical protein